MNELQAFVSRLVGEQCSRARVRPGTTLILDFGEFRPLRVAWSNPHDRGAWVVVAWVVVAWEASVRFEFTSGEVVEGDPDEKEHLSVIAERLVGALVDQATVDMPRLQLSLTFSDGTRLHIVPEASGEQEQWTVLSPDAGDRTVTGSGKWHVSA